MPAGGTGAAGTGAAGSSRRVVDTHVHVWPRGLVHSAQSVQTPLAASPADLLQAMDAAGVDAAVISPALVHLDNGYVLGAAATVPDRLRAVVGIDPRAPGAIAQAEAHAAHGAVAVRVHAGARPIESEDDVAAAGDLVEAAAGLGLVVQWTIRLPSVHLLTRAAARAPGVVQVLDHLGLPPDASDLGALAAIREVAAAPGTFVKLSGMYALSKQGYPFSDAWDWAAGVVDAFGPERTMWASDWPLSTERASLAQWRALPDLLPFLSATDRERILGGTADEVWRRRS